MPTPVTRRATFVATLLLTAALSFGQDKPRVKAGAYYFDGWTGQTHHVTDRLRNEFPDREPVWGWRDDSPDVMRRQIDLAADNGLSFFAFDWYYPEGPVKETPLNTGLKLFLDAPNRTRMEFCLLAVDHPGFKLGPDEWDAVTTIWVDLMKRPEHLKVAGKPLLIFFQAAPLKRDFGSPEQVRAAMDRLRDKARAAGLPGVTIAVCTSPGRVDKTDDFEELKAMGFDLLTGYNYHGFPKKLPLIQSYAAMAAGHQELWSRFAQKGILPYVPLVTVGWDKRPWEDPADPKTQEVYYPDRTPPMLKAFVKSAVKWIDDHPTGTPAERLLLLYAWNENGEGGYLTPTKWGGDTYLKTVGEALKTP